MNGLLACRICLSTESKLFALEHDLRDQFCILTYMEVNDTDGKMPYLCYECCFRLKSFTRFRDKCLKADGIMVALLLHDGEINASNLTYVDRVENGLASNLSRGSIYVTDSSFKLAEIKYETDNEEPLLKDDDCDSTFLDLDFKDDHSPCVSEDELPLVDIKKVEDGKKTVKLKNNDNLLIEKRNKMVKVENENKEPISKQKKKRAPLIEEFATEIILSKEEQLSELRERLKSINFLNSPYQCVYCYKGFIEEKAFENHSIKHDVSSGRHECDVCKMRYPSARRLRAHQISSHSRKYRCKQCQHTSHTKNQAREHEMWHKGHLYKCKLCGMSFSKPTSHLTHMRKRHPSEHVCRVCGDCFVGRHGLVMHLRKTHRLAGGQTPGGAARSRELYCAECHTHFESAEAWKRHTITSALHVTDNKYGNSCRVCGERFESVSEKEAHMKQHAKKTVRIRPTDNTIFLQCDQCDAKYVSRSKLLAHTRRKHLGIKYNKNIVCETCGKSCTSNAVLKYHQRTHTGEKPFQCADCPKRFSNSNQLRIHKRTHTDERPYLCTICKKTFRQKPALNRHTRVHTGEKPYECSHCGKTFSQSNSMKIHVNAVHLKVPQLYRGRNKLQKAVLTQIE